MNIFKIMKKVAQRGEILKTYVNRGKGGTLWLAVKGSARLYGILGKVFSGFGFREFRGAFTKQVLPNNIDQIYKELNDISQQHGITIDFTGLDFIKQQVNKPVVQVPQQPAVVTQTQQEKPAIQENKTQDSTSTLNQFSNKMHEELQQTSVNEHAETLIAIIDKKLEELAKMIDEVAKQDFIKEFLKFSAKFWNYSFANQMLIFFQTGGKAKYVKGKKQWEGLGRKVREDEAGKGIIILAPNFQQAYVSDNGIRFLLDFVVKYNSSNKPEFHDLTKDIGARKFFGTAKYMIKFPSTYQYLLSIKKEQQFQTTDQVEQYLEEKAAEGKGDKSGGRTLKDFKDVFVFDYTQTDPILGAKEVFEPPTIDKWDAPNVASAKADEYTQMAVRFAESKGIKVDFKDIQSAAAGVSSGKHITVGYTTGGERRFATLVHEIAHELLHWDEKIKLAFNKQEKEVDAESTAFIVMTHFGFEGQFAPNYLVLGYGAKSTDIRRRKEYISKAAKEIIMGMKEIQEGKTNQINKGARTYFVLVK